MYLPRIMIAAPASGSGKTIAVCGILSALQARGIKVAAGKCGPDYIDPLFHKICLGVPSQNLDLFFSSPRSLRQSFAGRSASYEITVVEGVMGYYDGMSVGEDTASSYAVAEALEIPVLLVVPCRGMALSIVPWILGMVKFRQDSHIRGIILNRVSKRLYPRIKQMLEEELAKEGVFIPVAGYIPEEEIFHLESRHLGLTLPGEAEKMRDRLYRMGQALAETIDMDLLLAIAKKAPELENPFFSGKKKEPEFPIRVAVAQDDAFCFYYEENLQMLRELGCELVPFSPLKEQQIPPSVSGMLLGGGYPELYAQFLSENYSMLRAVKTALEGGLPCIAECGGFLYLHTLLKTKEGKAWPMSGVFRGEAYPAGRLLRFGYVNLCAEKQGAYLAEGESLRGHEFHYWDSTENGSDCLAVKPDGHRFWHCIHMRGALFAGFPHISFVSNPLFAERFVNVCRNFARNVRAEGQKARYKAGG